ncbi:MAG: hypothetical protein AAFY41_17090, partial [Bacteroidota bacterium]
MYLKLLVPFYTGFKIAPGNRTNLDGPYVEFWDNFKSIDSRSMGLSSSLRSRPLQSGQARKGQIHHDLKSVSKPELYFKLEYKHGKQVEHSVLYSSIDRDTLPLPVEIIVIRLDDPTQYIDAKLNSLLERRLVSRLEKSQAQAFSSDVQIEDELKVLKDIVQRKTLTVLAKDLEIRIYDYDIAILTVPITISQPQRYHSAHALFLELLRDLGIEFVASLIQELYQDYLSGFLNGLMLQAKEYFRSEEIVQYQAVNSRDLVLWITRTLIFEEGDCQTNRYASITSNPRNWIEDFTKIWLKDTGIPDKAEDADESHQGIHSLEELLTQEDA